jgi:hypothetical protein
MKRACKCSSLAALRPDILDDWDWEANQGVDPEQLSPYSRKKVTWICRRDASHGTWQAAVKLRVQQGTRCPKCAVRKGSRRGLLQDEFPHLVEQLHPTKNAHLDLDKLMAGSDRVATWVCAACQNDPPGCPHPREWQARIATRTVQGRGCPYCAGRALCPCKSLAQLAPAVAAQWHPTKNGGKRPDQYGPQSGARVWWQCRHEGTGQVIEWQARIHDRGTTWRKLGRLSMPHSHRPRRKTL